MGLSRRERFARDAQSRSRARSSIADRVVVIGPPIAFDAVRVDARTMLDRGDARPAGSGVALLVGLLLLLIAASVVQTTAAERVKVADAKRSEIARRSLAVSSVMIEDPSAPMGAQSAGAGSPAPATDGATRASDAARSDSDGKDEDRRRLLLWKLRKALIEDPA